MSRPGTSADAGWQFGRFHLLPSAKRLLADGEPCAIGDRALDLLLALVARAGEVVSKKELIAAAWPGLVVEESNLRVQIGALRKLLDPADPDRCIRNVTGRGYCFVAAVTTIAAASVAPAPAFDTAPAAVLPLLLHRLIGRDAAARSLAETIATRRLVTVAGPGGIGKTTLAVSVARALASEFGEQVHLVQLAPLNDERLVASTLSAVLGLPVFSDDALPKLLDFLRPRRLLLVLDNCEHVIDAAAAVAEAVLKQAPEVHIVATSREPLRAEGEWVVRLPALDVPPADEALGAAALARYPAVELFAERARAGADTLQLADADYRLIADICRRLDGIPLAIELAAARVDSLGIAGIAARLDDRFALLSQGRRTALPRHRTLRAALDWSFELLDERQRQVLCRLSVFRARFSAESAAMIAASEGESDAGIIAIVAELAAKSLLATSRSQGRISYQLLETTRVYAAELLARQAEHELLRERHVRNLVSQFEHAEAEWPNEPSADWLDRYAYLIDDVRVALHWCFGPAARHAPGRGLLIASAPLWVRLALMQELRGLVEIALGNDVPAAAWDAATEMRLENLRGVAVWQTRLGPEMGAAFRRALSIAEQLGDHEVQIDALRGLFVERSSSGDYEAGFDVWRRLCVIERQSAWPLHALIRDTVQALCLHWTGDQASAWACAQALPQHPDIDCRRSRTGSICSHGVAARWAHARIAWLAGYPDQAIAATHALLDATPLQDDSGSLFLALAGGACQVSAWTGDRDLQQRCLDLLRRHSRHYAQDYWNSWQRSYEMVLGIDAMSRQAPDQPFPIAAIEPQFGPTQLESLATMNDKLAGPWVSARIRQQPKLWCAPEVMRIEALRLHRQGDIEAAFAHLDRALERARQQSARGWELRIVTSLAELHLAADSPRQAHDLLAPVHAAFTEGAATADLQRARRLLERARA